jgi:hypothetical protein
MKITEWLGWNNEASPYLLRRGELRRLMNLQPVRRGLLTTRPGMQKVYGEQDGEPILGLYRKITPFGSSDVLLLFQRAMRLSQDTDTDDTPVYRVTRLTSDPFQSQVIDEQLISPNGLTSITNMSVSEDRHGRLFIFYGHGAKPIMYRPALVGRLGVEAGIAAPLIQPVITPDGEGFFIEGIDVLDGGGSYWGPPTITVTGGDPERNARLKGVVKGGNLVTVDVVDGGANFKTYPNIVVGSDKTGSGFRGVGVLEADPGTQGFIESIGGNISLAHAPVAGETFGLNNQLNNNRILYLSSPHVLNAIATAPNPVPPNYRTMVLNSVVGIKVGDIVTARGATTPPPFNEPKNLVRVTAISSTTTTGGVSTHSVTLSKEWVPGAGLTYPVQFRRDWFMETTPAVYDPTLKRFTASFPLATRSGVGTNAEATITFSPKADGYGLGPVTYPNFTTPGGGPTPTPFAYKEVQWDNYAAYTTDYWKGESKPPDEKAPDKQLREYVGLQASGKQFIYGYTGPTNSENGKRGDVYWPDYSELSVWVCVGRHSDTIANWKRVDAKVYDNNTQPYALITLEPALKGVGEPPSSRQGLKKQPRQNNPGFSSNKQNGKQPNIPYQRAENYRPPVIKVLLRKCPDSWVTSYPSAGGNYNLPNWLKNKQDDPIDQNPPLDDYFNSKIRWWHSGDLTPRPIVDFRRSDGTAGIDWGTVEVVDAGTGWEKDTLFAVRLYQANPYDTIEDYNYTKRPAALSSTGRRINRNRAHRAFFSDSRYREFVFRANVADNNQTPGPPAEIAGGDVGSVMLLKRSTAADFETKYRSFVGVIAATGEATEFTFSTQSIPGTPTYTRPAGSNIVTVTTAAAHGLSVGDRVRLDFTSGTAQDGDYNIASVPTATTFTIAHQFSGAAGGNVAVTGLSFWPRQISGATIERVSGDHVALATPYEVKARSIVKCKTSGVLLDFSQVLSVGVPGNQALYLDKMCYPKVGVSASVGCTVANTNQTVAGLQRTLLTGVPLTVGTESVEALLVVGQKIWLADALISPRPTEIVEVVKTEGQVTVSLWVAGTASGSGQTTLRFAYDFEVYSGAMQSQIVDWTATQIVPGDNTQKVTSIRILNSGKNYYSAPSIEFRGGGLGYGLDVKAEVSDGKVTALSVIDPGRDWTAPPELFTADGPAVAVPVMRPAMRGKYRCAYRVVDRAETVVSTVTITGVEGDDAVKVTVNSATGIKPEMILDSARVPLSTSVVSVSGNQLVLSAAATGVGPLARVVIESGGSGYAQGETVSVSLPTTAPTGWVGDWPTPTATFSAVLESDGNGGYQVRSGTVTSAGASMYPTGEVPLVFSAPAAGGTPATGYACISAFNSSSSYDKSALVRDLTKPTTYSDFSPIVDVDAGPNDEREHCSELKWTLPGVKPPSRADMVEFYRTSADQSLVFYRLDIYGVPTEDGVEIVGEDTLTDAQLFDPDRANYAAVPVVLPNGALNAYRFGQPRTDMSACVAFQDRLWYGVSTSGDAANTIFYSEYDEFESCPDANELPIQNNYRTTDSLTALAPFGSMLLAMQTSHTYSIAYNSDPGIDASIQMMSHRGCLNQRCWDVYENVLYAADESGIYSMTRAGEVTALSTPIRDYFDLELLNFAARESFHLKVCERTKVLRFFCSLKSDPTDNPSHAFCFHIEQKTWWSETYPNSLCSAVSARPDTRRVSTTVYGAVDGNLYELIGDSDCAYRTIINTTITSGGAGYVEAPKITASNGYGATFQGIVSEGRLVDILVLTGGWGYFQAERMLAENGNTVVTEGGVKIAAGAEVPITLTIDPPPFAGPSLLTQSGMPLMTEGGGRLREGDDNPATATASVSLPVDIVTTAAFTTSSDPTSVGVVTLSQANDKIVPGMEISSPYLPQGCVVRSVNGTQLAFQFRDGTNAQALQTVPAGSIRFYTPFRTNIPYLLSTGNMEVANEANAPRGGGNLLDRSVTLLYSPTESDKELELLEYYNDSETPRANVHRRNRGGPGGFEHKQDSASTVLNASRWASHLAASTGVAKATFAGRSNEDSTGTDRHVRVDLYGRPSPANGNIGEPEPQKLVLHSLVIEGIVENAQ